MTGPKDTTRPISVAELLAKNGTLGAPVPARRRRRRGNSEAVTVAELTGEIPIIPDDLEPEAAGQHGPGSHVHRAHGSTHVDSDSEVAEAPVDEPVETSSHWSEPELRWPASTPPRPRESAAEQREARPQRSSYPRPVRTNGLPETDRVEARDDTSPDQPGAEGMKPDPLEDYAGMSVDVMDTDVRDAEPAVEDSAYVRSYLQFASNDVDSQDVGYRDIADVAEEEEYPEDADDHGESHSWSHSDSVRFGGMVVLQSFLAVAFGAGLFIAFDQLWRWNSIVALVLSVLVILGLVVGVRVVRRTEDIASTLIAVAVGALVTLGPLALSQSG